MERRLALWLRRFSACFARFLAEGELATVELLERLLGNSNQNRPRIMPMSCSVVKGGGNVPLSGRSRPLENYCARQYSVENSLEMLIDVRQLRFLACFRLVLPSLVTFS
jgi:hypothetical protein